MCRVIKTNKGINWVKGLLLPLIFGLVATLFISPEFSGAAPVEVFYDNFEVSEWNGLWTEDSQNDWFRSTQRAIDGSYSAEVDGSASDAALTSIIIDLQGKTNATVTFSWFIEVQLDSGEYLAFDVSTNGGSSWVEKAILRGNVDPENTWHNANIDITDISGGSLQIRFRAKMSRSNEDANVDLVRVTAWSPAAPAAPTGLSATAVSSSQIDLSWTDNSTDETGFKIERKTGAGGTYAQIDTVGAGITTYQNTGLSASTEYYYRVRAYNANGDSDYSNEANATTTLPGKFWEWECNVNPTTLDGNGDTIGDWIVRGQSPGTGFSDNLTTDGGLTVYAGGDTLDTRPLYDATDADLAVEIKWKSLNDDTVNNWNSILWWNLDYTGGQMGRPWCWVNRSGGNTIIHMQNVTGGSSSDVTVSGIDYFTMRWQIDTVADTLAVYINGEGSPRETYDYTLAGENGDKFATLVVGNGRGYIDYVHVYAGDYAIMPPPTAPSAPSGLGATTISSSQINLSWTDNSNNEDGFKIERKTGTGGTYAQIDTVGAGITTYQNTGLSASTEYYYRVRAYNTGGDSGYSNEANATTLPTVPLAPSGLGATAVSSSQINLSWTDNSNNEDGFKIGRKTGAGGTYAQIDTVGAGITTYQNTGLSASTEYYYRVRAYNTGGDSGYSNEANATTMDPGTTVGTILREWWTGISGTAVSDLTSNANYPDYPTGSEEITSLEGPMDWAENYGTRIYGYLHPSATGDYTFWIASDDNSELWLSTDDNPANASLIANVPGWTSSRQWTKYAEQQSSAIPLTGGQKYYIEALQKEGGGGDNLAVAWQGPGITQQVIDGSYLSPWWTGIGMGKGLIGNYYDNTDFTNPKLSRLDPTVNFDWGNGSPDPLIGVDTFSVRWAGQVQPLYSETYTFYTTTDDGVRLWVNGQQLVDAWVDQGPTEYSGTISLTAGRKYDITMEYYENGGGAVAKLSWSSPTQPKEIVPQLQLYSSQAPPLYDWAVDGERMLNLDGTINWAEYEYVANNIDQVWVRDYLFGPKYSYYHPIPETIPTMYCNSNADGWHLGGQTRQPTSEEFVEWYSEGGQFVLSPDVGAPAVWQPGVVQCWDGGIWGFKDPILPAYSVLNHLTYDNVMTQNGSRAVPDPGPVSQDWINASGGTVPAPPVTVVRTHATAGVTGFMIYKNGLIGVCGTGNEYYHWGIAGYTRTCIKLPDGKVPTAAAVAGCNEFLLVTVWDTVNQKGQLAVIAVNGPVVRTFDCMSHEDRPCFWGIPNWPGVKAMKLLGYVDLPFAAPMAIKISQDFIAGNGRGFCDNYGMNLDSQAERDTWYNWSGGEGKKTARCGYAVISSRAENKVAFVDLQPLFQYYRTMYFTTQANYDQTKIEGPADNQWPYTFAYAAGQTPTVYSTIDVTQPTAVAAGLPWCMWLIRNGNDAMENAYVTTMDGNLLMYKVGDLMTTASGGSIGAPFNTVAIGKNPSSLDYGHGCAYGDDLFITCRGDNAVYYLYSDGSTRGVLRDSRITDAVSACGSGVGRCFRDACWHAPLLHLMDFTGRKVLNYRFHCGYTDDDSIPVGDPPNPPNESTIFEFSGEQSPPGYPFLFVRAEVI